MILEKWRVLRRLGREDEAFEALADRLYPAVFRFLGHLTGSQEEARDLVQQTFLKAKEGFGPFRGECGAKPWLFPIAYREYLLWLRARSRRPEEELLERYPAPAGVSVDALCMAEQIEALPEELRTTFVLQEIVGLSVREIAHALDIPEGTIKSRCHTARARLRESLKDAWYPASAENLEVDHGF